MSKFVLPLSDFNRIHQVAHGVLKDIGKVEVACVFFAIFGAYVLEHKYGLQARPMAGGLSLRVAENKNLIYGRLDGDEWVVDDSGYHMWVQTPTHVIDFTSPIYPEAFSTVDPTINLPRKMFQKKIRENKNTLDDIKEIGDFLVMPDPMLTNLMIQRFLAKPVSSDLIQVAEHWFGKRSDKQEFSSQMMNNLGEVTTIQLPPVKANGFW